MAPTATGDHRFADRQRLRAVRAELDHLVSIRAATGLDAPQRARYDELLAVEVELLRATRPNASATSS